MIGAVGSIELTVSDTDTAIAYGSGDVPVLATPRVLALAEEAAVAALASHLADGQTSVGIHAELHHVKATQVGGEVVATAAVAESDGRKISFEIEVLEGGEKVAYGTHRRVVVDRERFGG